MKDIKVREFPDCDICLSKKTAVYDAPLIGVSSWANMCPKCFDENGAKNNLNGFRRVLIVKSPKPVDAGTPEKAYEITTLEEVLNQDEIRVVACPNCGEERSVETDADYIFTCEVCEQLVKVSDIMESIF